MNKLTKTTGLLAICLFALLVCGGCASDKEMRENFGRGSHVFTEEKTGDKYIIRHHIGDGYTLELFQKRRPQ